MRGIDVHRHVSVWACTLSITKSEAIASGDLGSRVAYRGFCGQGADCIARTCPKRATVHIIATSIASQRCCMISHTHSATHSESAQRQNQPSESSTVIHVVEPTSGEIPSTPRATKEVYNKATIQLDMRRANPGLGTPWQKWCSISHENCSFRRVHIRLDTSQVFDRNEFVLAAHPCRRCNTRFCSQRTRGVASRERWMLCHSGSEGRLAAAPC